MEFSSSITKENLMRAFAGESQARNRYTLAANAAKQQNYEFLSRVFKLTADQEKAHAEIFYNFLRQSNGENIAIGRMKIMPTIEMIMPTTRVTSDIIVK